MKALTKEQRKEFPAPSWSDHVLNGKRERTRAMLVIADVDKAMAQFEVKP